MKERIEKLITDCAIYDDGVIAAMYAIANEALELAARECEKVGDCGTWGTKGLGIDMKITDWHDHGTKKKCAAAIRKLKVE